MITEIHHIYSREGKTLHSESVPHRTRSIYVHLIYGVGEEASLLREESLLLRQTESSESTFIEDGMAVSRDDVRRWGTWNK